MSTLFLTYLGCYAQCNRSSQLDETLCEHHRRTSCIHIGMHRIQWYFQGTTSRLIWASSSRIDVRPLCRRVCVFWHAPHDWATSSWYNGCAKGCDSHGGPPSQYQLDLGTKQLLQWCVPKTLRNFADHHHHHHRHHQHHRPSWVVQPRDKLHQSISTIDILIHEWILF